MPMAFRKDGTRHFTAIARNNSRLMQLVRQAFLIQRESSREKSITLQFCEFSRQKKASELELSKKLLYSLKVVLWRRNNPRGFPQLLRNPGATTHPHNPKVIWQKVDVIVT